MGELRGISEEQFLKLVQTTPFFALKLVRLLASRLKRTHALNELLV